MNTKELIQALQDCIKINPTYANYSVRVVEGITERTSNDDHEAEVNYWASHIEVRESITEDPNNGEIIIYSNE
jgi:hypothetical protein